MKHIFKIVVMIIVFILSCSIIMTTNNNSPIPKVSGNGGEKTVMIGRFFNDVDSWDQFILHGIITMGDITTLIIGHCHSPMGSRAGMSDMYFNIHIGTKIYVYDHYFTILSWVEGISITVRVD
jgi:hypothetical protein